MDQFNIECYGFDSINTRTIEFELMLRQIDDIKEKFILIMYNIGYKKNEIAFILNVHPSTITRQYERCVKRIISSSYSEADNKSLQNLSKNNR